MNHDETEARWRTILVATDFSPYSQAALSHACRLAETHRASLHLIHATAGEFGDERRREVLEQLGRALDAHAELKLSVHYEALEGPPHRRILDYAQQQHVDLIVMGTHGRSGLAKLAWGSVSDRVLLGATCPVIIVKSDGSPVAAATARRELTASDFVPLAETSPGEEDVSSEPVSSPAVDLIRRALSLRATDIHLGPAGDHEVAIRFRIDGRLEEYCRVDLMVAQHLIQQMKLMAQLDISEPFRPKEGALRLPHTLADVEVRITTAPVAGGEAVALRLFARDRIYFPLSELGFSPGSQAQVEQMLQHGEGVILVTGPTGAGKSTTVYSMLERLRTDGTRNLVSIEDPVEFPVPFVQQMSVDEVHGITMSSGLRTLLRMDPDVIFVGEIRDREAAETAMRAASSGRYVFSTLHTRDVASTVTALRDLHVDNRSLGGNLTGIINQRLIRKLCTHCRMAQPISDTQRQVFLDHGLTPPSHVSVEKGCEACRGTGYHGRLGIYETALISSAVRQQIVDGVDEEMVRTTLRQQGTPSLTAAALEKVSAQSTSFTEAITMRWL